MDTLSQRFKKVWASNKIPASGVFELTPRCNFNCKMCYIHLSDDQMIGKAELSTEQWKTIAAQAIEQGLLKVLLTGGECTLHPGFTELYGYLRANGIIVSVNTNGSALNDKIIACFREHLPNQVNVSLYGYNEDSYEKNTGKRAFAKVKKGIEELCAIGIKPNISITISKHNADDVTEILEIADQFHLKKRIEYDLTEARTGTGRSYKNYALSIEEIVAMNIKILERYQVPLKKNAPLSFTPRWVPADTSYNEIPCSAGKWHYVIRWDGQMCGCFNLPVPGVYVQDIGLAKAWAMTGEYLKTYPAPIECKTCILKDACTNCVTLRSDPGNPGHCNLDRCFLTRERYNAGIIGLGRKNGEQLEASGDCC